MHMHLSLPIHKRQSPYSMQPQQPTQQHSHQQQHNSDITMRDDMESSASTSGAFSTSSTLVTANSQYPHNPSDYYDNNNSAISSSGYYSSAATGMTDYMRSTPTSAAFQTHNTYHQPGSGYLSPSNMQQNTSTAPHISSPLAMSSGNGAANSASRVLSPQMGGASSASSTTNRVSYSFRGRGRNGSYQQQNTSAAFSPPSSYDNNSIASNLFLQPQNGATSGYPSNQQRFSNVMALSNSSANNRSRCLSSSSMDSNMSSSTIGFSRITPAMASMSVQHPTTNAASPYQSYSSSPQPPTSGAYQYHYQQQSSPYQYQQQQQTPSFYEQDPSQLLQRLELSSPATTSHPAGSRPFEHRGSLDGLQAATSEFGSYTQVSTVERSLTSSSGGELGLGIVAGGMVMATPADESDPALSTTPATENSSTPSTTAARPSKRTASIEPRPYLGPDGKTWQYPCGQCEKVFTTKSNLKRHLENINIHNTPYERRRDQKRWQGHEKKHASREETTLRMRRWREANREKNKFNDMRCRVYRLAKDKFGPVDTDEKEAWIQVEIQKRKSSLLLRHTRKAEWKGAIHSANSASSSSSPCFFSSAMATQGGAQSFGVGHPSGQDQTLYDGSAIAANENVKDGDRTFIELLKSENVPRRRRSRQALNANKAAAAGGDTADASHAVASTDPNNHQQNGMENVYGSFGLMKGSLSSSSLLGFGEGLPSTFGSATSLSQRGQPPSKKRRSRKQRSISEKAAMYRRRTVAGSSTNNLAGAGCSATGGLYGTNYTEDSRFQELCQGVSQTRVVSQALLMGKDTAQHQAGQEGIETLVDELDIHHSRNASGNSVTTQGGLYGDKDMTGWLDWQSSQNVNGANPGQTMNGTRQYPFPEMAFESAQALRDRKGLAKASGIKIEIPPHQLQQQYQPGMQSDWAMMDVGNGNDNMVGGSATSVASSFNSQPLSANSSMQSPMLGQNNAFTSGSGPSDNTGDAIDDASKATGVGRRVVHKAASHEMFSGFPSSYPPQAQSTTAVSQYPFQSFYGAGMNVGQPSQQQQPPLPMSLAQQAQVRSLAQNRQLLEPRTQGLGTNSLTGPSEMDYFTTLVLPSVANGSSVPNYLAKQQLALRRHSTQLSNLSTSLPQATHHSVAANAGRSNLSNNLAMSCAPESSSLLPEIASLIAESDQEQRFFSENQSPSSVRKHGRNDEENHNGSIPSTTPFFVKQQLTMPVGSTTLAAHYYPFPNAFSPAYPTFSPMNSGSVGDVSSVGANANTTGGLPPLPDHILGERGTKVMMPAHPHTMGEMMLTVGASAGQADQQGIMPENRRDSLSSSPEDDSMEADLSLSAPSQLQQQQQQPVAQGQASRTLQASTSELMHDLMNDHQHQDETMLLMLPEEDESSGSLLGRPSTLQPSSVSLSSILHGSSDSNGRKTHQTHASQSSISKMSLSEGESAILAPTSSSQGHERTGSTGWWPGGGAHHSMASTPTTVTTAATVLSTTSGSTKSGGMTPSSSTSSASGHFSQRSHHSKNGSISSTLQMFKKGHKASNSSINSAASTAAIKSLESVDQQVRSLAIHSSSNTTMDPSLTSGKPPLQSGPASSSSFKLQHKKNNPSTASTGSSSTTFGGMISSSFTSMTASFSNNFLSASTSSSILSAGAGPKKAPSQTSLAEATESKKSLEDATASNHGSRPGHHPRRSSSILDEFANVMLTRK